MDANATHDQIERAKDLAEAINEHTDEADEDGDDDEDDEDVKNDVDDSYHRKRLMSIQSQTSER